MTYNDYLGGDPVLVTAALTGGIHGKEANPNIPETPAEIGRAAEACEAAGASIVHLHARRETGERAFSRERFQEVTEAVRERTDLIVQHSTGGTGAPLERRRQPLQTDPAPDMASLDMGPVNRYRHVTSENTRGTIDALATDMRDRGIKPELEAFNPGHLNEIHAFLDRVDLDDPAYVNLILGPGTLTIPTPQNLLNLVENLPDGALFTTLAFGQHQLPLTTMAIVLGGHVRVGLEDNVYVRRGELAESNAQLVTRTVDIAELLGRPIASPEEARGMLGL